jgi:hypothetical protein
MDYQKIYNQIITQALNRDLKGYSEKHHIIPKCMGGLNTPENLIKLTAREHFLCHRLLCEIYPDNTQLKQALFFMSRNTKYPEIISSNMYESLKEFHSNTISKIHKNKTISQKTREKISKALKGKPKPEYFKEIASKTRKGATISESHKNKIREYMTGKIYSDESKEKMSQLYHQRPQSVIEKTKKSISLAKSSPIIQYNTDGIFLKEWPSIKEAYTYHKGDISSCCQGRQKTAAGFIWKYKSK